MTKNEEININKLVENYIDNKIEIKKNIFEGLINTSALARKIAKENNLQNHIDAIISGIRRYDLIENKKENFESLYKLIKRARISTKTKLFSLMIKRTDKIEEKISSIYSEINFKRDSTLQIFQVSNYIKIISDEEYKEEITKLFTKEEIKENKDNLGEMVIQYKDDITKIPGIFALLSNELAINNISIIDSMICHREHLFIVKEKDLRNAFIVVLGLSE